MNEQPVARTSTEHLDMLQAAQARVRAAAIRLKRANEDLAYAEREHREANDALDKLENPSAHVAAGVTGHD